MVQSCKIGVTVVTGFRFPHFFPLFLLFYQLLRFPNLSLSLFPLHQFSPYAIGGHKDENDKQQHPNSDKDAWYQELGGRVLS